VAHITALAIESLEIAFYPSDFLRQGDSHEQAYL
jgi:hypothetical protein